MKNDQRKAFLIGGGIASLSAAVFLIRDAEFLGSNISIFEEGPEWGGSLDASGDPELGYVMRGGRMFEEHFVCTYDLLSQIPSYDTPSKSARDDIFDFFREAGWNAHRRLVDRNGATMDVATLGLNGSDRLELLRLIGTPEHLLANRQIQECFGAHFFKSPFWLMWCSMFAFQPWHSAIEMRRYVLRFIHLFPKLADMTGIYHTRYNQYHSMIVPLQRWLGEKGVHLLSKTQVMDIEFAPGTSQSLVTHLSTKNAKGMLDISVAPTDLVIFTNGSMTAGSSQGSMQQPAPLVRAIENGSWKLWQKLASRNKKFGNPDKFIDDIDATKWLSLTVTTKSEEFKKWMEEYTQAELGRGGLVTFPQSSWMLTFNLHHNPVYPQQPQGTYIWWAYGLSPDRVGDYIQKPMSSCGGQELLREILSHLHMPDSLQDHVLANSRAIPCMMPVITSQFMPREAGDRPDVVPAGSVNLAFVGQYCEIADDTVFTVEYSVRSANEAVTRLLQLPRPVPKMYQGKYRPEVLVNAILESIK